MPHAVGQTRRQDPVDPSLQDGRKAEPPERKLKQQEVGLEELLLFGHNLGGERAVTRGDGLLHRELEEVGIGKTREVVFAADWIESHRVEVGDLDRMPPLGQRRNREVFQGAVEGSRLGMGVNDECFH